MVWACARLVVSSSGNGSLHTMHHAWLRSSHPSWNIAKILCIKSFGVSDVHQAHELWMSLNNRSFWPDYKQIYQPTFKTESGNKIIQSIPMAKTIGASTTRSKNLKTSMNSLLRQTSSQQWVSFALSKVNSHACLISGLFLAWARQTISKSGSLRLNRSLPAKGLICLLRILFRCHSLGNLQISPVISALDTQTSSPALVSSSCLIDHAALQSSATHKLACTSSLVIVG